MWVTLLVLLEGFCKLPIRLFVELIILAVVAAVVVMGMRYGKTAVLDTPIIIHQSGYHITLAPQLGCAQAFIADIAKQFLETHQPQGDIPALYFEVRDPNVPVRGENCYLLAAAFRGGMLYFQAIIPQPLLRDADSHLKTLREFSGAVLAQLPVVQAVDGCGTKKLADTIQLAAQQMKIAVKTLQEMD